MCMGAFLTLESSSIKKILPVQHFPNILTNNDESQISVNAKYGDETKRLAFPATPVLSSSMQKCLVMLAPSP